MPNRQAGSPITSSTATSRNHRKETSHGNQILPRFENALGQRHRPCGRASGRVRRRGPGRRSSGVPGRRHHGGGQHRPPRRHQASGVVTAIYILLGTVALLAFALWLATRSARKAGAAVEREALTGKVLDNVAQAKRTRDRLWSDPAYRYELRAKFTSQ